MATLLALSAANRGATQVGASGQALMQSQRLAKSVSQALVGSAAAFPEVRESVRGAGAERARPAGRRRAGAQGAPAPVQEAIEPMMPLVDRAEKNANVVLGAAEAMLTQVGQALRAINRQSSDLLETAETVSSLKLQQDASAAELSAVGQLGDADAAHRQERQRIPDHGGRQPRGGVPARQGPELLPRDLATGLLNGSAELRLPAHARRRRRASG